MLAVSQATSPLPDAARRSWGGCRWAPSFNDKAWDPEHDWLREERRAPGSVPDIVLRVTRSLVRQ